MGNTYTSAGGPAQDPPGYPQGQQGYMQRQAYPNAYPQGQQEYMQGQGYPNAYQQGQQAYPNAYPPQPAPVPQPCTSSTCSSSNQPMQAYCPAYHGMDQLDYPWLTPVYGKLVKAEFNENNQGWIDYEQMHATTPGGPMHNWWVEHCQAISHDVNNLATSHIATFVTPATRTIVMRFTFDNGNVYRSDVDTQLFTRFYQLEEDYAKALYAQQ